MNAARFPDDPVARVHPVANYIKKLEEEDAESFPNPINLAREENALKGDGLKDRVKRIETKPENGQQSQPVATPPPATSQAQTEKDKQSDHVDKTIDTLNYLSLALVIVLLSSMILFGFEKPLS